MSLMTFSSIYIYSIKKVSKPFLKTVRVKIKFEILQTNCFSVIAIVRGVLIK